MKICANSALSSFVPWGTKITSEKDILPAVSEASTWSPIRTSEIALSSPDKRVIVSVPLKHEGTLFVASAFAAAKKVVECGTVDGAFVGCAVVGGVVDGAFVGFAIVGGVVDGAVVAAGDE